jgi:hypothetical protein
MWMDIVVILLLALPLVLSRSTLPRLLDSNDDASLPKGKDERLERLFVSGGEADEHSSPRSLSGNAGVSQLHIHVMSDLKVTR